MGLKIILLVVTRWQVLLVGGLLILFLPLVSYIASIQPRGRRAGFVPPAERALRKATD
jgi:hypothetical protein